jgi:hypothetical protein
MPRLYQQHRRSYLYDAYGRSFAYGLQIRLAAPTGYESPSTPYDSWVSGSGFPSRDFVTAHRLGYITAPARRQATCPKWEIDRNTSFQMLR